MHPSDHLHIKQKVFIFGKTIFSNFLRMLTLSLQEYKTCFDALYEKLCLFANSYVRNLALSKDIVQEVFIKIWEDKVVFRSQTAIKSYLYTAVRNKSLDYLKSKNYRVTDHLEDIDFLLVESDAYFMREVVITETSHLIQTAVSTLPSRCAQVIQLVIKGYSNIEIASALKVSINTVKGHKKIAYKRLNPLLKASFLLLFLLMLE